MGGFPTAGYDLIEATALANERSAATSDCGGSLVKNRPRIVRCGGPAGGAVCCLKESFTGFTQFVTAFD
jgi:hypothetical protein